MSALVQVDWFAIEYPLHDPDGSIGGGHPYYRTCDICYLSATEDAWAGKGVDDFRQFHRVCGGVDDGLTICENCLEDFLKEQP